MTINHSNEIWKDGPIDLLVDGRTDGRTDARVTTTAITPKPPPTAISPKLTTNDSNNNG